MSTGSHAGRPKSWVAVSIIFVGFVIGGVGITLGPDWVVFGIGAALIAVGGIVALAVDIMTDVVIDEPRH
ncbi:HGxxPAAW family protein [Actinomadura welshii]